MSGKKIENKIKTLPRPTLMKTAVKKVNKGTPSANPAKSKSLPAKKTAPFTVRISAVKEKPLTFAVSKKITVKKVDKKASFSRQIQKTVKPSAKKPDKLPEKNDIRKSAAVKNTPVKKIDKKNASFRITAKTKKLSAKKTVKFAVPKKTLKTPVRKDIRKSATAKKTPAKKTDKKAPVSRKTAKTVKPSAKKTLKVAVPKKALKTPVRKDIRKSATARKTPAKKIDKKAPSSGKILKAEKTSAKKTVKAAVLKKTVAPPKESFADKTLNISEDLKKSEVHADTDIISDIELTQKDPELRPEGKVPSEDIYHSDDAETLVISQGLVDRTAKTEETAPQVPSAGETGSDDIPPLSDTTVEMHIQDIGQKSIPTIDEEAEFDANIPASDLKLNVPLRRKRKTRNVFLTIALAVLVIILVNAAVIFYKSRSVSVEIRSEIPETQDVNKAPAEGVKTESAVAEVIPGKSNDALDGISKESPEADENEPLPKSLAYVRDQAVQAAKEGKFNESFVVIERLLDIGFAKSSLLSDKMIILVWAEKYYLAIDMFESYRKKNAPDINLLNAIGTAYRKTGRYNDAIKCCDESLALNKENPDAVKGKVFSMIASGRSFEAYEYIRSEMKNRQNVPTWLNLLTGEAYVVEGRTDDAETFFSEFLKANPGNVFAKRMLAGILVQKKQKLDVAEKMIDEILSVEPANIDVMFLKVTILQSKKLYLEAYELNEKILSMNKRYQPSLNAKPQILTDMKTAPPAAETPRKPDDRVSFPVKRRLMGDFAAAEISGQKSVKPAQ